jgi:hypothetical protein
MATPPAGPRTPGTTEVELDGRVSVYSPLTNDVVMLNDTASSIWRLVDDRSTFEEILDALALAYGTPAETMAHDVAAMLRSFAEAGLISPRTDFPAADT